MTPEEFVASEHVAMYLSRLDPDRVAAVKKSLETLAKYGRKQRWPKDVLAFVSEYWENAVGDAE